jgi:hypothetical protein
MVQMRQGLAARRAMGAWQSEAEFLVRLAEAYGRIGQAEEALRLLAEALAVVDKGDLWYEADAICRISCPIRAHRLSTCTILKSCGRIQQLLSSS